MKSAFMLGFGMILILEGSAHSEVVSDSLQWVGGGGRYARIGGYGDGLNLKLEPPPYFPDQGNSAKSSNDPLLKNKLDDLGKVIWDLKYWQNEAPVQIGHLKTQLESYKKQDRDERWKLRAKNDPPPEFPQIPRLEKQIPMLEQQAVDQVKALIQKKAQIEMAIQLHDKERWETLRARFNAGECTPEEIERVVAEKDQFYIKQIFGPPDFAGNTKVFGKRGSYDALEFRYDRRIKNKYTEKTEDLYLYFFGDGENKRCIGRKLGSDGTISLYESE